MPEPAFQAIARMLVQLLLIGYVLTYIFEADQPAIIVILGAHGDACGRELDRFAPTAE